MKVIIAGSRNIIDYSYVENAIKESQFEITEVVSGTAKGVDRLGEHYAAVNDIKLTKFPAQWDLYGKSAGHRRNADMATYADALIAIWDGKSKGTKHMIEEAGKRKLNVYLKTMVRG